jgi:hypothetical protein
MTFLSWCKLNCKYNFILGDIVRDYQAICKEQKALGLKKPKFTEQHLIEWNAKDDVLNEFRKARTEYANLIRKLK